MTSPFERDLEEVIGDRAPPKVIKLPLSAWNSAYEGRPLCDISIGLRLPGQETGEAIEAEALKALREALPNGEDLAVRAYQESKLVNLVADCICDPHDVQASHEMFPTPNALLPVCLTKAGIRRLFDEIERLQVETSPIFPEASDDQAAAVADLIESGAVQRLASTDPARSGRVRRYLGFLFEELV